MPVTLPQGTKEYLIVDVDDILNSLVTLDGTTPQFDVRAPDNSWKYQNQAATNQVMKVYCLVDTALGGAWAAGEYRLYIDFVTAPELPRLGPFMFIVDAS